MDGGHYYMVVEAENSSKIDYYIDMHSFMITNKRKGITACNTGTTPINIISSYNEPISLCANTAYRYALVYDLFTLKKSQSLVFFIRETNGGRDLMINVPSRYLYQMALQL